MSLSAKRHTNKIRSTEIGIGTIKKYLVPTSEARPSTQAVGPVIQTKSALVCGLHKTFKKYPQSEVRFFCKLKHCTTKYCSEN
jgi:hypothetical protein